jgi:hypothetical protein
MGKFTTKKGDCVEVTQTDGSVRQEEGAGSGGPLWISLLYHGLTVDLPLPTASPSVSVTVDSGY